MLGLEVKARWQGTMTPLAAPAGLAMPSKHMTYAPQNRQIPACFCLSQPCKYAQQAGSQLMLLKGPAHTA